MDKPTEKQQIEAAALKREFPNRIIWMRVNPKRPKQYKIYATKTDKKILSWLNKGWRCFLFSDCDYKYLHTPPGVKNG